MKRDTGRTAPPMRGKRFGKLIYILVMASFIIPIIFLIVMMAAAPEAENKAGYHSHADYVLMLVQCILGVIVMHIPSLLAKRFKFEPPVVLYTLYIIFLYCAEK